MLSASFQHLQGIGQRRERDLWKSGITSWDDFEQRLNGQIPLFADLSENGRSDILHGSRLALQKDDADFFAKALPKREFYRIALSFPAQTLFLDIETTGLSKYYDEITLVGWSLGGQYGVYIKGEDAAVLCDAVSKAKALVTFNGSLFDLPFLRKELPDLPLPLAHVDLRFLARGVGLTGGQKIIEHRLGITRAEELTELNGRVAPILWHRYCKGDLGALKLLLLYNHADIEGMKDILDTVVDRLQGQQMIPDKVRPSLPFSGLRCSADDLIENAVIRANRIRARKRPKAQRRRIRLKDLMSSARKIRVVGIDLAGSEKRASGWCLLDGTYAEARLLNTDDGIINATLAGKPDLVSIDSPLSLPRGRTLATDDDPGRKEYGIMRSCERTLKRRGINVYPCLIPSMQALTARGIRLAGNFRQAGVPVIESYPGAAQDIMGIPRKRVSLEFLREGLVEFGVRGEWLREAKTHDELDAITSAVVGIFFWCGRFERLGSDEEEYLVIPDLKVNPHHWLSRNVIGISGPIAAGKTTAAECLKEKGYYYSRYSAVLAEILKQREEKASRASLQKIGEEINQSPGQRWLGTRLVKQLPECDKIVIDGLRHPEDHAFLVERYGPGFLHVYVDAPYANRLDRYVRLGHTKRDFSIAAGHPVERNVEKLEGFAHRRINNSSTLGSFRERTRRMARRSLSNSS